MAENDQNQHFNPILVFKKKTNNPNGTLLVHEPSQLIGPWIGCVIWPPKMDISCQEAIFWPPKLPKSAF